MLDQTPVTSNFARWEFTLSQTAVRHGIPNDPSPEDWARIEALALNVLQPAREDLGVIVISSGFRSRRVNELVGGSLRSQHMRGEAADIVPVTRPLDELWRWLTKHAPFDQMIWEFGRWVHVSYSERNRRQRLRAYKGPGGKTMYVPVLRDQEPGT